MCDRVAIIHRGRTLSTGPVSELLSRAASGYRLRVRPVEAARAALEARFPDGVSDDGEESLLLVGARGGDPGGGGGARRRGRRRDGRRAPRVDARGRLPRDHGRGDGMTFLPLVENEVLKLWKRRRFRLVLLILVALIGIVVFAPVEEQRRFAGQKDWHVETQERVARMRNWLRQGRMPQTAAPSWMQFEIARLQYHLDRNINPGGGDGTALRARLRELRELSAPAPARDRLRGGHRLVGILRRDDQAAADAPDRAPSRARLEARGAAARGRADRSPRRRSWRTRSEASRTAIGAGALPC